MRKAIEKICSNCGKTFSYTGTHTKRNKHFFCCYDCYIDFKTKKVTAVCEWCGKEFLKKRSDVKRTGHNFCSPGCCLAYRHKAGETAANQRIDGEVVYRTIAEQKIGRPLLPTEEIHHIDGDHMNNDPENLMVLSKAEHSRIHASWKGHEGKRGLDRNSVALAEQITTVSKSSLFAYIGNISDSKVMENIKAAVKTQLRLDETS